MGLITEADAEEAIRRWGGMIGMVSRCFGKIIGEKTLCVPTALQKYRQLLKFSVINQFKHY